MTKIVDLMAVDDTDRDLNWFHVALQAAVELELATTPLYLCAMCSVQDPDGTDPVRALIKSIAVEEVGHLATACNLLTAIGRPPRSTRPPRCSSAPVPRTLVRRRAPGADDPVVGTDQGPRVQRLHGD